LDETARKAKEELFRWAAVRAVGESALPAKGHEKALKILLRAGKDADPRVRVEALKALARAQHPSTGKMAVYCTLRDPWSWARVQCLRVVARRCPAGAGKALLSAWKVGAGPSKGVLLYTMTACRYKGAKKLLEGVIDAYEENFGLAGQAARLLPEVGDWSSAWKVLKVASVVLKDAHSHTRREALYVDLVGALRLLLARRGSDGEGGEKEKKGPKAQNRVPRSLRKGILSLSRRAVKEAKNDKTKKATLRLVAALCPGPDAWKALRQWMGKGHSPAVRRAGDAALKSCASKNR